MKKKLLTVLLVAVAAVAGAFGLAACKDTSSGGGVGEHAHTFGEYISDANATCVEDGTKTATCTYMGCTETDTVSEAGSALGHNFGSYIPDYNATCLASGTKTATCTRENCTATDCIINDNDPPHGHRFAEYIADNNASCLEYGTKTAICSYPNCSETDTIININDPARGHVFEVYVSDGNATCIDDGTKTAVCSHAGCLQTDTVTDVGSALGHNFVSYVSNGNSTCNSFGTKTAQCERCTAKNTLTDESQSFKPHTYAGGKCEVCKASQLTYTLSQDETYCIVSGLANDCKDLKIVIPEFENGLPVKEIGVHAFMYLISAYRCKDIQSFKLPSSITKIQRGAFNGCEALNSINIPENTEVIESGAFAGCKALRSINLPNGLRQLGDSAFSSSGITSLSIPESVTYIGNSIFSGCNSLMTITLPFVESYFGYYFGGKPANSSNRQESNAPASLKKVVILGGVIA